MDFLRVTLYFVSSIEISCKWKPINLDNPDKSKTRKSDRKESLRRNLSKTPEKQIVKQVSSPKKPRLESQIKVQTPPPRPVPVENNVSHSFFHWKF